MPVTPFQQAVFQCIARNRGDHSYVAGATPILLRADSPRFSGDIDLFHDVSEAVSLSFAADRSALEADGYEVKIVLETPTFIRAVLSKDNQTLKVEWTQDSAWRFFPLEKDSLLGARLSLPDLATNKVLAAAGREEPRDIIDLVYLDETFLPLGYCVWAACGKDEGWTPELICQQLRHHGRLSQAALDTVHTAAPLHAPAFKQRWLEKVTDAGKLCGQLPSADIGCFYLDAVSRKIVAPKTFDQNIVRHRGSVKGAWPKVADWPEPLPTGMESRLTDFFGKA